MHPDVVRLSAREPLPEGTRVAPELRREDTSPPPTSSRLVLLVHGYNNTARDAAESYETFVRMAGLAKLQRHGQVCWLHWPGNLRWGIFSALSYPLEIAKARTSAARVQEFLELLAETTAGGWKLEITLICHSLGNRLALELVERLRVNPHIAVRRACLMAAAVPVGHVEPQGELRPAAEAIERSLVLHSGSDAILHYAFPLGQTAAGDGFFPRAVGRFGQPGLSLWTACENMGRHSYGHGAYWPGVQCADAILQFLGEPVAILPAPAALPAPPELASAAVASRTLGVRTLATRELATL
jgi:hypothetical protein